jgi:hypothetical protein
MYLYTTFNEAYESINRYKAGAYKAFKKGKLYLNKWKFEILD